MQTYTFIVLSNQPFDLPLKTNKWHIATRLAKRGHQVIYVDPPLRFKALKAFIKNPSLNLSALFMSTERKSENLMVYRPANLFNFWPFSLINTSMHSGQIKKILNMFPRKNEELIIWTYHFDFPDLENFLKKFKYNILLYDVVDEYTAFPEYSQRKKVNPSVVSWIQWLDDELKIWLNQKGLQGTNWVLHREKWLSDKADLVFASAPGLVEKFKKWRPDVYYLPNAAAVEVFDKPQSSFKEPEDLKNIPHPRIGFSGAIDNYKTNIKLIEKCAKTYRHYHFVLIGPEKLSDPDIDLSVLKSLKNVHFLGMKPWEETPAYFAYFDIYFIPYNLNDYTVKGCFPVKYFEGLAAGLPTIVTNMPAYNGFDPDGYVAKDDTEFVFTIEKALQQNSPERIAARKKMASENSYDGKVDKELHLLSSKLS